MGLKNLVGDVLEYGRCPVTGNTYWHADLVSVPYSATSGVIVSARALDEFSRRVVAQAVFTRSRANNFVTTSKKYSLEEITELIPSGCTHIARM